MATAKNKTPQSATITKARDSWPTARQLMDLNSNSNNRSRTHGTSLRRKPLGGEAFKYLGSWTNWEHGYRLVAALQSDERLPTTELKGKIFANKNSPQHPTGGYITMVLAIGLYTACATWRQT
jgi:hypothetical protein